ncbi:MAG: hypothetical protein ACXVPN_04715 [Bacteroidia bacterium]
MKRVLLFSALAIVAVSFSSCRKSYRCVCRYVYTGGDYTTVTIANSNKRDAKEWCQAIQKSEAQPGVSSTCSLQ